MPIVFWRQQQKSSAMLAIYDSRQEIESSKTSRKQYNTYYLVVIAKTIHMDNNRRMRANKE